MQLVQNLFSRFGLVLIRMQPGVSHDPNKALGQCGYCGGDVLYKDGDRDLRGQARHDTCLARHLDGLLYETRLSWVYMQLVDLSPSQIMLRRLSNMFLAPAVKPTPEQLNELFRCMATEFEKTQAPPDKLERLREIEAQLFAERA